MSWRKEPTRDLPAPNYKARDTQDSARFNNALGEVLSSTDGRGISTSNSYDKLGRLIGRSASVDVDGNGSADSVLDQWIYDPVGAAGALASSQRSIAGVLERSEQHSYDTHGRNIQTDTIQATNLGNRSYTQRFAWDANYGRLKARSLPHTTTQAAEVLWTRYSKYGHPSQESDGRTGADYRQITQVDASGQPTQELLGGHWQSSTGRREATGSVTGVGHAFDNALQRGIDYRYDVYGNLTEQALDGGAVIESLQYDTLHRLTQTARSGAASGTVNYGYDAAGNFQYKSDFSTAVTNAYAYSGGACGGGPNAVKSVQLKAGGTRSYCYDGAGNLISDNSGMSLRYDASQRPTAMHRGSADSQFRYGPDGDKARQWGSSGQRLYVGGIEDRPDIGETESYLGDYALIQTSPSGRKVQYLLRDRLGSVIGVADDAGTVEWRGFDAFGAPRSGTWADKSPNILGPNTATAHGFTQHEHLDGLGLIHMNGRVYDYALGRFLGVDPFIQFPGNSQSLNPYSYILNNPLAGTDPTGYVVRDQRSICFRSPGSCPNVQGAADNGSPQGSGSSTRGGRRANGAVAGQKSTGAQGTSGGEASDTGAPDERENASSVANARSEGNGKPAKTGQNPTSLTGVGKDAPLIVNLPNGKTVLIIPIKLTGVDDATRASALAMAQDKASQISSVDGNTSVQIVDADALNSKQPVTFDISPGKQEMNNPQGEGIRTQTLSGHLDGSRADIGKTIVHDGIHPFGVSDLYTYARDTGGNIIIDPQGNPVVISDPNNNNIMGPNLGNEFNRNQINSEPRFRNPNIKECNAMDDFGAGC